jgi:uncharacterized protein
VRRRVLLDTGPLVAVLSSRDAGRRACLQELDRVVAPLLTCWPVITEAAWLLRREDRAVEHLLARLHDGFLELLPIDASAGPALQGFLNRYRRVGAQLADAALMYLAEREDIDTIFTLDRRDFTVYRTSKGRALRIIPDGHLS